MRKKYQNFSFKKQKHKKLQQLVKSGRVTLEKMTPMELNETTSLDKILLSQEFWLNVPAEKVGYIFFNGI